MSIDQKAALAKRNVVTVSEDDARAIIFDDHDDYSVVREDAGEQGRWSTFVGVVVKHEPTGKFFRTYYQRGNTEYQDNEYDMSTELTEVKPVQVTVTEYEDVLS